MLLLLPLLRSTELLAAFAVTFGLADFSTVPPTTALAQRSFRSGGFGLVLGLIGAAHQVGSALGSEIGGVLYDATGGYGAFFVSAARRLRDRRRSSASASTARTSSYAGGAGPTRSSRHTARVRLARFSV